MPDTGLPQYAGCLLDGVLTTCVWGFCRYTGEDDILSVMASFVAVALESPFSITPPIYIRLVKFLPKILHKMGFKAP